MKDPHFIGYIPDWLQPWIALCILVSPFVTWLITWLSEKKTQRMQAEQKILISEQLSRQGRQINNAINARDSASVQYGDYMANTEAYTKAVLLVENQIDANNGKSADVFNIKFTVVGMKFSWIFVIEPLFTLLEQSNKDLRFCFQILLVSPDFIQSLPITDENKDDWADQSRGKINAFVRKINYLEKLEYGDRLSVSIKQYFSIPQYHGFIINDDHLYISRTDWIFVNNKPHKLTVGENRYRYFNRTPFDELEESSPNKEIKNERVDLFLHWHNFYWETSGVPILHYKNGSWITRPPELTRNILA